MTSGPRLEQRQRLASAGRRAGFALSIGVNLVLLWIVANVLEWDILPFLTDAFADVAPVVMLSIIVTIAVDAWLLINDRPRSGTVWAVLVGAVNLAATVVLLRVFPFDFADTGFPWESVVRIFLLVAIVGTAIGLIGDAIKSISRTRSVR